MKKDFIRSAAKSIFSPSPVKGFLLALLLSILFFLLNPENLTPGEKQWFYISPFIIWFIYVLFPGVISDISYIFSKKDKNKYRL
jgi:hypothetical protein